MEVYENRPNFADAAAQDDARQRLAHVCILIAIFSLVCLQFHFMVFMIPVCMVFGCLWFH